jgi:hypothetical protein
MTVIAVLNFVVAGLGSCLLVVQVASAGKGFSGLGAGGDPKAVKMQEDIERTVENAVPGGKAYEYIQIGLNVLLTILLIVGGIGLLNMQPWGRTACLVYAVLSVLEKVAGLIIAVTIVLPALQPVWQAAAQNDPAMARTMEMVMTLLFLGVGCISMVYPVVVLIMMLLPSTGKALREWGQYSSRPEDFERSDEERRWEGEEAERRGPDDRFEDERWGR